MTALEDLGEQLDRLSAAAVCEAMEFNWIDSGQLLIQLGELRRQLRDLRLRQKQVAAFNKYVEQDLVRTSGDGSEADD